MGEGPKRPRAGLCLAVLCVLVAIVAFKLSKTVQQLTMEAERPRPEDIFIVSFPRSGNNWARFLLGHLWIYQDCAVLDAGKELDFHTIETLIPDVEFGPNRKAFPTFGAPRLFKSHQPYAPGAVPGDCAATVGPMDNYQCSCPNCPLQWKKIIHIVRDGRAVACSYYHFRRGLDDTAVGEKSIRKDFARFLGEDHYPGVSWAEHVQSFLSLATNASTEAPNILTVRYEDLQADTARELRRMGEWIGWSFSEKALSAAVAASTFSRMRAKEEAQGLALFDKHHKHRDPSWRMTRKGGGSGDWKECFVDSVSSSGAVRDWLIKAKPVMESLSYDVYEET